MKKSLFRGALRLLAYTCLILSSAANAVNSFSDDFESGLGQWTGKSGGGHHGVIVADPLGSGHGSVLTFTGLVGGGDIYTVDQLSFTEPFQITFDYLGLPSLGGNPDDLGGYLGIAYNLNPLVQFVDHFWYAGTDANYPGLLVHLIDDGQWHHYSFSLDGATAGTFRLMVEDFADAGGVARDVFFDNIVVRVPEPTSLSLGMIAAALSIMRRRPSRQEERFQT